MNDPVIRVMLVDDHEVVVEGIEALLSGFDDIEVVATTTKGEAAVSLYGSALPDVVLTDLAMPDIDGVELTRRLCAADSASRILVLTAFADRRLIQQAIHAGALGYLPKSVSSSELVDGVRRAARGEVVMRGDALASMTASTSQRIGDDLTAREHEVLRNLADGLSNKQIANVLGLTPGTVRIHVSNVLRKLEVSNRTAAARIAHEQGLVTEPALRQ
jgi:DNA-binding NarL/FixJ family response regulator